MIYLRSVQRQINSISNWLACFNSHSFRGLPAKLNLIGSCAFVLHWLLDTLGNISKIEASSNTRSRGVIRATPTWENLSVTIQKEITEEQHKVQRIWLLKFMTRRLNIWKSLTYFEGVVLKPLWESLVPLHNTKSYCLTTCLSDETSLYNVRKVMLWLFCTKYFYLEILLTIKTLNFGWQQHHFAECSAIFPWGQKKIPGCH